VKLHGLVAATYTPFKADGSLNLAAVEAQAAQLLENQVPVAFIAGTTGESHSLRVEERRQLAERWMRVARGTDLRIVVHVGTNCLPDARELAAHAERLGALAIAALAPSYFKPRDLESLVAWTAAVAGAAPHTPFYFYDIPVLTGVSLSMPEFLARAAEAVPTLVGLKFSNPDLMAYQLCLRAAGGRFDVPWGTDECLLAALAVGGRGGVGSTYNFAAPIYHRLLAAFARGDLDTARAEQFRSVQIVRTLAARGYMASAKALLNLLGVNVGPARLPHANLSPEQVAALRCELEQLGFFDWIRLPR
jgi:N-acetylneuraminate lyase